MPSRARDRALAAALALAGAAALAQPVPGATPPGAEACAACHGPDGNSPAPAVPSIAGQPRVFIENQLVLIREGLRDVPSMKAVMGALDDAQIGALAAHFAAQAARPAAGAVDGDKRRLGAELSRRGLCGTCHLPGYVGQGQVPRLAAQHETYLAATMRMYRDKPEPGRDTAMSAVLQGLRDAEIDALAHYFARPAP